MKWEQIKKLLVDTDECIEWPYFRDVQGYGRVSYLGKKHRVHRVVTGNGVLLDRGTIVLHSCDNRACINPRHLRVGTQKENMLEMMAKGRGKGQFRKKGQT